MNAKLKSVIPYFVAILIFIVVSLLYFSPVLEGKKIYQNDIVHFTGMAKEVNDFRAENKTEPYWTNSAFGGMPTYNLSAKYQNNYIKKIDSLLRFLPRPADYLFLYFLSFFVLLTILKVDWKLAILGSLAFGFSTYYIIILGVGHNAKAHAIAYMPLVIAGILWVLKYKKYFYGFLLTTIALALEINASHPQMTYYLLLSVIILGIIYLIDAVKNKKILPFFKEIAILIVAAVIAVGVNSTGLMATQEYVKHSTRGKSELTITPEGTPKKATTGLSKQYITEYSYGMAETFNLFIPRFMGGGNAENIGTDSHTYRFLQGKVSPKQAKGFVENAPMYWGKQPIVEAPAYIGAVLIFLFVLGIFVVKGKLKKWLLATVIVTILLSWGKNFATITNFFIDYVPLYNKFRAVSSIQVMVELAIPLLGILALQQLFSENTDLKSKLKALQKTTLITAGLALAFTVFGGSLFSFEGLRDANYDQMLPGLLDAIMNDRKELLFNDSLRTFLLVMASAGVLFLYLKGKLKKNATIISFIVLILFDLVQVDRRYVNETNFVNSRAMERPFKASEADKEILKDTSYYRVANFAKSPMNDGSTSYFHKSIGGYHAAKLGRYQELFDYQIAKNNVEVLNMLNTKYIVFPNQNGQEQVQLNTDANGNAWFISDLKVVKNANEEIKELDSLDTKNIAVINAKNSSNLKLKYQKDSLNSIELINYKTNQLTYKSSANIPQFAVFSEIYYKNGWNAYINDKQVPHYQVNYVLRGMPVPAGNHIIKFKFEPKVIQKGNTVTLISYGLLLVVSLGWFFRKKKK